jgi:hypothetical protein
MVPLHINILVKSLWQHAIWDRTIIVINIYIYIHLCVCVHSLTFDAQELMHDKFELEPYTNNAKKEFVYTEVLTQISTTIGVHINHLCHDTALQFSYKLN